MKALFLESLPYHSAFRVGSHHYADRFLGAGWEGMWLSQPLSPLHFVRPTKRDFDERVRGWRRGPVCYGAMRYYSPMTLAPTARAPVLRTSAVARHSVLVTVPRAESVVRKAGFESPELVWLTNPVYQPLAARLNPECLAVRIADDHSQFREVPDAIRELEAASERAADVVFAVAGSVYDRLSSVRDGVIRLPNGVDAGFFAMPQAEPADLASIPSPRAVYVGALEYWFDVELFGECLRARPDVQFVVIGPRGEGRLAALAGMPNLHILGARPYEEIPAYLQHCDIGLVPFARDQLVDSIHPIKVYEYLAAGLRVLSVRWTELEFMGAPVSLTGVSGFVAELGRMIDTRDSDAARIARLEYARMNSWDARFAVVKREVERVREAAAQSVSRGGGGSEYA